MAVTQLVLAIFLSSFSFFFWHTYRYWVGVCALGRKAKKTSRTLIATCDHARDLGPVLEAEVTHEVSIHLTSQRRRGKEKVKRVLTVDSLLRDMSDDSFHLALTKGGR